MTTTYSTNQLRREDTVTLRALLEALKSYSETKGLQCQTTQCALNIDGYLCGVINVYITDGKCPHFNPDIPRDAFHPIQFRQPRAGNGPV